MKSTLRIILMLLGLAAATPAMAQCPAITGAHATSITATTVAAGGNFTVPQASSFTISCTPTAGGATRSATIAASAILTFPHLTGLLPSTAYSGQVVSNCAGGQSSAPAFFTFVTAPLPPANDECAMATFLPETADCTTPTTGTVLSATVSLPAGSLCSHDPLSPSHDVWYRFVASGPTQVLTVTTQFQAGIEVSTGPCAAITSTSPALYCMTFGSNSPVAGGQLRTQLNDLTAGQTYYLRVYPTNSYAGALGGVGTFTLCLNPGPPAPPNDDCANAITLPVYGPTQCYATPGTVAGAWPTPNLPASCGTTPAPRDVWYRFVATNPRHIITMNANQASSQIRMELYSGTCAAPVPVIYCATTNFVGSPGSTSPAEMSLYSLTMGQTYLLRVYAIGDALLGAAGGFGICVRGELPCAQPFLPAAVPAATSAQLSWQAQGTPPTFVVEYGSPGFVLGTGTRQYTTTPALTLTGLRPNTNYEYYVYGDCTSLTGLGYSTPQVGPTAFRTTPAPAACTPPTNLTVTGVTPAYITLAWQAAAIAGSTFELEYGPAGFTPGTGTAITGLTQNSAQASGLLPSTDYCFYVRRDCGNFIGPVCVRTNGPFPPPDLVVSTVQTLPGGAYNNVTITGTGALTLSSDLSVAGTLTVQSGGALRTTWATGQGLLQCATVIGPGAFVLEDGATLDICARLGISASGSTGAVQLQGPRSFSPGATYQYDGMSNAQQSQTTGSGLPAEVRNLHIGNDRTAFVLLTQPVAVREVLTVAGFGSQLFTGGRSLTLLSDATGTALVNNAGGQVVGDVTVQRFINSAYRGVGYRHYSAPISTATVGSLATGGFGPVVNAAYNTALHPEQTTPYPTVYGYDEARLATSQAVGGAEFDKGWVSPASLLAPLVAGRGYTVHVPGTAVVSFTGPLNQTAVSSDFLARGPGADVGWQLVGNPYPSPLDVSTLTMGPGTANNLRNVGAAVYVFESTGPYVGQYRTAVAGVGGSSVIASGQGFFVRALPDPTGQLPTQVQFFNSNRVTTFSAGDNTFRRPAAETRPLLTLGLRDAAGHTDPASIYFTPAATPGFDPTADATKLPNTTGLNLASLVGSESYAINALPLLGTAPLVVPLTVDVPATGSYELAVDQLLNFTPGTTLYLRDALLNTLTPLTATTRYAFTLPGTSAPGRFSVEFRPAGALATAAQVLAARLQLYPNPTRAGSRTVLTLPAPAGERVSATLLNALGQTVSAFALPVRAGQAMALLPTAGLAAGVYVLRVQAGATVITKRLVID